MNLRTCLLYLAAGASLLAQTANSTLTGYITDPSGSAAPNATVDFFESRTGQRWSTKSNDSGSFTQPYLPAGNYKVQITAPGFAVYSVKSVEVPANTTIRIDVAMKLATTQESIEVNAEQAQLQTDRSDLSRSLPAKQLLELPLATRNYQELASILPGVTPTSNVSTTLQNPMDTRAYQANGQLRSSNNSMIDGTDNNDPLIGVTINVPPVEAISEVNMMLGNFTADFGRSGGAVSSVVTRSGTNSPHGSLYEFHQNDRLRARNFFNVAPQPKPNLTRNQYGATLGGPLVKDRTFLFGFYQGFLQRQAQTTTTTVPDPAWRTGDFSRTPQLNLFDPATGNRDGTGRTPFAGNIIPASRIHPVSRAIVPELVQPNQPGALESNLINNVPSRVRGHQFGIKADHRFNERSFGFIKYDRGSFATKNSAAIGDILGDGAESTVATHTAIANLTFTVTPKLLTENRLGFNRYRSQVEGINANEELSRRFGIGDPTPTSLSQRGLARIAITGMAVLGANFIYPIVSTDNIFNASSSWTWIAAKHTVKFGGDIRRFRGDRLQATGLNLGPRGLFNFNPGPTQLRNGPALGPNGNFGNSFAAFLLGAADQTSRTYLTVTPTNRQWNHFLYANDTIQVTRKLTIDLGLRWELYTPVVPRQAGGASNYDPDTNSLLVAGVGQVGMSTGIIQDNNNFAPRLGFAYRARESFVVRGGYGISYFTGINGYTGGTLSTQFPVVGNIQVGNTNDFIVDGNLSSIPGIPSVPIPSNGILNPAPNQAFFHIPFNNRYPYVQSFHLTLQKRLPWQSVVDVAYVGTLGRRLPVQYDLNAALPGTGTNGRPLFQRFGRSATTNARAYAVNNNFHSLQANWNRRFAKGLFLNAAYTWSKAMESGVVTSHVDFRRNYGPASYDRTHMFNLAHLYELPFGKGKRWATTGPAAALLGGWQLNGILRMVTGLPGTVTANATACNCPGNGNFADHISPVSYPRGIGRGQFWFTRESFAVPGANRFGNGATGNIRGPGFRNYDFSLFRRVTLRERYSLEFRAEAFNLSNTPRFALPERNINSANFGQILATLDDSGERQLQFGLRFSF
jgi:hypothetical protein